MPSKRATQRPFTTSGARNLADEGAVGEGEALAEDDGAPFRRSAADGGAAHAMRFSRSFHTRRPSQGTVRFVACRGSVADPPEEFSVSALEERFSSAKLARRKVAKIRIATGLIILILMTR